MEVVDWGVGWRRRMVLVVGDGIGGSMRFLVTAGASSSSSSSMKILGLLLLRLDVVVRLLPVVLGASG